MAFDRHALHYFQLLVRSSLDEDCLTCRHQCIETQRMDIDLYEALQYTSPWASLQLPAQWGGGMVSGVALGLFLSAQKSLCSRLIRSRFAGVISSIFSSSPILLIRETVRLMLLGPLVGLWISCSLKSDNGSSMWSSSIL